MTRRAVFCLLRLLFGFRVRGLEHLPPGAAVLVANHPSALDPVFIGTALPERLVFVAAEEFLSWRVVGWVIRTYGCIPVRRGAVDTESVREALAALAAGRKVGIFPEGQVTPEPLPPRRGAALLAARARVPIVPVAVSGSGRVFPLGAQLPRPGKVTVAVGPPLPPPGEGRAAQEAAMDAAMAWIRAHGADGPAGRGG